MACIFITLALIVLFGSLFRSSALEYEFQLIANSELQRPHVPTVNYQLPYPGKIQPTNPLWPFKVLRDKLVLSLTYDDLEKAKLNLLLADKRLMSGFWLLEQGEYEDSAEVFRKAEVYLENAYKLSRNANDSGQDVAVFSQVLALASLKHREVLEKSLPQFPEDAQPVINQILGNTKQIFEKACQVINESGAETVINPFEVN